MSTYDQVKAKEHEERQAKNAEDRAVSKLAREQEEARVQKAIEKAASYTFPQKPKSIRESIYYSSAIELVCEQQIGFRDFDKLVTQIESATNHQNKAIKATSSRLHGIYQLLRTHGVANIIIEPAVYNDDSTLKWEGKKRVGHGPTVKTPAVTHEVRREDFYQYARKELQDAL